MARSSAVGPASAPPDEVAVHADTSGQRGRAIDPRRFAGVDGRPLRPSRSQRLSRSPISCGHWRSASGSLERPPMAVDHAALAARLT
jgi:hypothetical protein